MAYETIKYEVDDQILTITLNRPDKLNAFNGTMQQEMIDAFDAADKDDNIRAIIVTGAGRGFCAGADLSSGANTFDRDARRGPVKRLADGKVHYSDPQVRDGGGQVTLRIFKCLKPVIAAVNGPAVGIGVTMQLAMDIRIASEAARFGFVFSQRGIVPEAASSWFLPRIVGISQALTSVLRAAARLLGRQILRQGRLVQMPDAAEDVEFPRGVDVELDQLPLGAGRRGELRLPAIAHLGLTLDRRQALRTGDAGVGARLLHPPGRQPHVVAVLERLRDQALESVVAENVPPRLVGER